MRDQMQSAEITQLRNMVQQQAIANEKLQQMLHESFRVPSNVHPAQTTTMTGESVQMGPLQAQTWKSAPAVAPPGIMQPVVPTIHGLNQGLPHSRATGSNPVIIKDPITGQPTLVSKTMGLYPKPMKGVSLIQPHLQQIPCLRMLPLVVVEVEAVVVPMEEEVAVVIPLCSMSSLLTALLITCIVENKQAASLRRIRTCSYV